MHALRYHSQTHLVAKVMKSGKVAGAIAYFLEAVTCILRGTSEGGGSVGVYGSGPGASALPLPPGATGASGGKHLSARGFARLSPMEKVSS